MQSERLQGGSISLARFRGPHETSGDHVSQRCLCDEVDANRRRCLEVGPYIVQQLSHVEGSNAGEFTVIHSVAFRGALDIEVESSVVTLSGNAAPVACRRGALEVTFMPFSRKDKPALQCNGILRCSLARAANNIDNVVSDDVFQDARAQAVWCDPLVGVANPYSPPL